MDNLGILYSCYHDVSREGEQFVPCHIFSYQIEGRLKVDDGDNVYFFEEGDYRFIRRNQLAKFVKYPRPGGDFKSVSILLDDRLLKEMSIEEDIEGRHEVDLPGTFKLAENELYESFISSLMPYLTYDKDDLQTVFELKAREVLWLIMKFNPELKNIIFDFNEPGKVDLEAFMLQNFRFNVGIDRFAYLTGRSLATFKRDFKKIFNDAPGKWLKKRRLKEAYYLIKEKRQKPSEVYLDVGFEDLSHFSYAFKNNFGLNPSDLLL